MGKKRDATDSWLRKQWDTYPVPPSKKKKKSNTEQAIEDLTVAADAYNQAGQSIYTMNSGYINVTPATATQTINTPNTWQYVTTMVGGGGGPNWYGTYPHPEDHRILHKPGKCAVCDEMPALQELRAAWGINCTGEYDKGKIMCPHDRARLDEEAKKCKMSMDEIKQEILDRVTERS